MTFSTMDEIVTLTIKDTYNGTWQGINCHCAECRYAECHYAECLALSDYP